MADQSKSCHVLKQVKLVIKINLEIDDCSNVTFYSVFSVLSGLKHNLIIGLPTLVTDLVDIFVRIKSIGNSNPVYAAESIHEFLMLEQKPKRSRQAKKKLDFNPEVSPVSSLGAKREYLHDSINQSLADIVKKKFIPSEEFKGNYPDGNLEEIDFPLLPVDSQSNLSRFSEW